MTDLLEHGPGLYYVPEHDKILRIIEVIATPGISFYYVETESNLGVYPLSFQDFLEGGLVWLGDY